jgi:hypothetical protein
VKAQERPASQNEPLARLVMRPKVYGFALSRRASSHRPATVRPVPIPMVEISSLVMGEGQLDEQRVEF